ACGLFARSRSSSSSEIRVFPRRCLAALGRCPRSRSLISSEIRGFRRFALVAARAPFGAAFFLPTRRRFADVFLAERFLVGRFLAEDFLVEDLLAMANS